MSKSSSLPDVDYSVIVPCFNEEAAIRETIEQLHTATQSQRCEIVVVDDGSNDGTARELEQARTRFDNLRVVTHAENRGYGAALKTGIRAARGELIAITDADGTYPNERIPELVAHCEGYDMVVGARVADDVDYSKVRAGPKFFLNQWVNWLSGQRVPDINSGMRVFRKGVAEQFFGILPDSFSFTVTITLAMLTNYRPVKFVPIGYKRRIGQSKIQPIRDTIRFSMLIMRTGMYFAPLRALAPFVGVLGVLALASLAYDVFAIRNLTDKTVLLFLFVFNTAMFALLADMIDKRSSR